MPGTHVGISSRTVSQRVEILGTTPEIRLTETDQTDPAGRYRLGVSADSFWIERSGTAGWTNGLGSASNFVFFQYDRTNTSLLLNPYESNAWNVRLLAGAAATPGTNANLVVQAHATTPSIDLQTGNGVGAALVSRLLVGGGTGTPDIDVASARLDLNGNAVAGLASVRGNGTADLNILANKVATDATARNIGFYLLDPATDTETLLARMTANALTPSLDLQDDLLLRIGTTGDTGIANISAGLAANTASAGTLEGTVVNPIALAANSLVIGNITNDGDILLAVSKAGTSHMAFMADGSTGDTLLGAPTGQSVDVYIAGTQVLDIAANLMTYSAAASTANQVLALTNTSNAAAASHAYMDISVGGTTSTGDPQVRLTIPGGTSWYMGVDNSGNDAFWIGTGTAVPTNGYVRILNLAGASFFAILPPALSVVGTQVSDVPSLVVDARTLTITNQAQETGLVGAVTVNTVTLNQSGGAVTVDKAAGVTSIGFTAGASVTLTHSSAFRALTGGAAVNVSGLFLEAQTAGTTASYGIILEDSATAGIWLSSNADSVDAAGGILFGLSQDTNLYRVAANQLRTDDSLLLGGTLGLTGTRVSNIFTTSQTTTNAETVDSWGATKQNITPYQDALAIIRGVSVVSYEHQAAFDATGRRKLGVLAESISEGLVTPVDDYVGLGRGPRLDMLGLAALNTRAIQQVDDRLTRLERQLIAAGLVPEE